MSVCEDSTATAEDGRVSTSFRSVAVAIFFFLLARVLESGDMPQALPPRPEFDFDRVRKPAGEQVQGSPPSAKNFGLPGHFRLEQQRMIVNLRGNEDGLLGVAGGT